MMGPNDSDTYRPAIYDFEYRERTADIEFWKRLVFSLDLETGTILDLCCGTGRVTFPLAGRFSHYRGFKIFGADISKKMLAFAHEKKAKLDPKDASSIQLYYGDIRELSGWPSHFDLALCAFNSFLHMMDQEDQLRALISILSQLKLGGYFLADIFNPDVTKLAQGLGPRWIREEIVAEDPENDTLLVRNASTKYNPANQIIEARFYYSIYRLGGNRELLESYWSPLKLKVIFPEEWRLLLTTAGFMIAREFGDYEMGEFNNSSQQMLFLCQKPS